MKTKYDPIIFQQTESVDLDKFIIGTYIMKAETSDYLMRAGAIAVEQTTGTWMPVPDETPEVRRKHVGRVISAFPVPGYESQMPEGETLYVIKIAFPWVNIGQQMPELLSTVFGNISMTQNLKLVDLEFPKSFTKGFNGPKFGIEGIRKLLNISERPPILAMVKPCTGIPIDVIKRQFYNLAISGVDIIKDDELIANPEYAPLEERVIACLDAADKAYKETGKRVLYFPNITDRQDKVFKNAKRCIELGAQGLMLNAHALGYGVLGALAQDPEINVPLLAHPCYAGAAFLGDNTGLSSQLIHGKFMRLDGADIVVYNCAYGKVPDVKERYIRVAQTLRSPFHDLKSTFPSPCAGIHPGVIPAIMKDIGNDIVIGAGAGIHAHPMGMAAGVAALKQAAESAMENIPIEEYAKDHPELDAAIKLWGVYDPNKSIYELTK
jgi:2,3-diketo-5-methylthiopentyl-1-phosphate enolase